MTAVDAVLDEPATEIRRRVAASELSATEITEATLDRIARRDQHIHSFLTVDGDGALTQAAEVDRRMAAGEAPGPLCGVPVSIKDLYLTRGLRTTFGSLLFGEYVPETDSVHAQRLRAAGAIIVGKTNTPEFGIFIRTLNRLGPETVNPWDLSRTAGGSSGGAAASVAAGLTPIAIGSDGGGSIRIPAALCGVLGVFPSHGLVPRHGGRIGTRLFSSAGPLTRNVADAAITLQVLAGSDPRDPLSWSEPAADMSAAVGCPIGGVRLAPVALADASGMTTAVLDAVAALAARLQDLGAELEDLRMLDVEPFRAPFYDMMMADRLASGGRELLEDAAASSRLTDYARAHFEKAAYVTGEQYSRALDERLRARAVLHELLDGVDVLVMPSVGLLAPEIDDSAPALPEVARRNYVSFTFMQNYTGLPAVSVPAGLVDGLPVGLQFVGRPRSEPLLLGLAGAAQSLQPTPRAALHAVDGG